MKRILVRGVNWLGDAVMTTPALLRLREAYPRSTIVMLTQEKFADLWKHHPAVNEVLALKADEGPMLVARELRQHKFDLAVVLPNSFRSALEVWLARIPIRVGYGAGGRRVLLTDPVCARPGAVKMHKRTKREVKRLTAPSLKPVSSGAAYELAAHHTHHYLHLMTELGASAKPLPPLLNVIPAERDAAVERVTNAFREKKDGAGQSAPTTWIGLNPGAEYGPAKRWPAEKFAAVAREISKQVGNCGWLLFGGVKDFRTCNEIARMIGGNARNLAGHTTLRELMALLKICRVVVTNDTGPMHVAAALGTPVVVPFGSTSPELTGPGLPGDSTHQLIKSAAPCSPCFLRECPIDFRCMMGIRSHQIVTAVMEAFRAEAKRFG